MFANIQVWRKSHIQKHWNMEIGMQSIEVEKKSRGEEKVDWDMLGR